MVGDGIPALVTRGFAARGADAIEASEALPEFLGVYEASATNLSRPYPGVRDTLVELRRRGYRTAICTNKAERATIAVLRGLALQPLFDGIAGGDRFAVKKPDPGHLLELIAELGARPDRARDDRRQRERRAAAHAAGVPLVLMRYGYARVEPGGRSLPPRCSTASPTCPIRWKGSGSPLNLRSAPRTCNSARCPVTSRYRSPFRA